MLHSRGYVVLQIQRLQEENISISCQVRTLQLVSCSQTAIFSFY